MTAFRTTGLAIATLALGFAASCKDSTGPDTPRVTAREVHKIAGDDQDAARGYPVAAPLRVRVIGSDGEPFAGAAVQWTVMTGQATLDRSQSTTDASGEAEARVTVVGTIGSIAVSAVVSGAPTATFAIEGLDPCYFGNVPPIAIGTTRTGTLGPLDCNYGNRWNDLFMFTAPEMYQAVMVRVKSTSFDPRVELHSFVHEWAFWRQDTVNATREVRIKALVPFGDHGLVANSAEPNVTGTYEVSLSQAPEDVSNCESVVAILGIWTTQQLAPTDCQTPTNAYADRIGIPLFEGDMIRITHDAETFSPRLQLLLGDEVVAEDDGPAGGTAVIEYTATEPLALYVLSASSVEPQATGLYQLIAAHAFIIGGSTSNRAARAASPSKRRPTVLSFPRIGEKQ
jgi:hypothetical protein